MRNGSSAPASRPWPVALLLIGISLALILSYLVHWVVDVTPGRERGTDFSATYVAGLVLRDGHGDQLYDQGVEAERHATINLPGFHTTLPFLTAPSSAVIGAAFTVFDPGPAFRIFSILQFALLVLACLVAVRAAPWPSGTPPGTRMAAVLVGAAGIGLQNLLLLGQWDGLNALGLALCYAWLRAAERPGAQRSRLEFAAGAALAISAAVAKPHLAAGVLCFLVGRRCWRALAGAGAGALLVALSWLVIPGPAAALAFPGGAAGSLDQAATTMLSVTGLVASWFGTGTGARVLIGAGIAAALASAILLGHRSRGGPIEVPLAGAVALGLVASPHLLCHDLVLLAPVIGWMLGWAVSKAMTPGVPAMPAAGSPREGRAPSAVPHLRGATSASAGLASMRAFSVLGVWLVLDLAAHFDIGNDTSAPPGRVVPLVLIGIGVAAWSGTRTELPNAQTQHGAIGP